MSLIDASMPVTATPAAERESEKQQRGSPSRAISPSLSFPLHGCFFGEASSPPPLLPSPAPHSPHCACSPSLFRFNMIYAEFASALSKALTPPAAGAPGASSAGAPTIPAGMTKEELSAKFSGSIIWLKAAAHTDAR